MIQDVWDCCVAVRSGESWRVMRSQHSDLALTPPARPPPPIRARAACDMVRRRPPAVPPPPDDYDDPILQNETNDVIWQRRMHVADDASGSLGLCRRCRHVDESSHVTVSCADNEYVAEPSTASDVLGQTSSSSSVRLLDLRRPVTSRLSDETVKPLSTHDTGVTCKDCDGCLCESCQRAVQLCAGRRRTVLGVCLPCLCYCWLLTRTTCTNRPHICRCRADQL